MENRFGFITLFLIYIFISFSVFNGVCFANNRYPLSPWQIKIYNFVNVLSFVMENSPDWIKDYAFPRNSSDREANKEKRKEKIKDIQEIWNSPPIR